MTVVVVVAWPRSRPGEGELNIICWAGYCEDGTGHPGHRLGDSVRAGDRLPDQRLVEDTSDQMVDLMRDQVSTTVSRPRGATARLVRGGDVDPVNVDLVPNYETISTISRISPTTRSTGPTTGSRTAVELNC